MVHTYKIQYMLHFVTYPAMANCCTVHTTMNQTPAAILKILPWKSPWLSRHHSYKKAGERGKDTGLTNHGWKKDAMNERRKGGINHVSTWLMTWRYDILFFCIFERIVHRLLISFINSHMLKEKKTCAYHKLSTFIEIYALRQNWNTCTKSWIRFKK